MKDKNTVIRNLDNFSLARGIGILLVIFGHSLAIFVSANSIENNWKIVFNALAIVSEGFMIMFFMISGFSFYKRKMKKCVRIQGRLYLIPYCIVSLLIHLSHLGNMIIRKRPFPKQLIPTYLFGLNAVGGKEIAGYEISDIGIFWFIWALMGGWIIYNQISQIKNEKIRRCLVAVCILLAWLLTYVSKIWPFCVHTMLLAVGGIASGVQIREKKLLEKPWPAYLWIGTLGFSLISMAFGEVKIMQGVWRLGLLDVCGVFSLGLLLVKFFYIVERKVDRLHLPLVGFVKTLGFHSLWIICIHAYESNIIPWYKLSRYFNPYASVIICFVARFIFIYLIYFGVKKIRHYFMKFKHRKSRIVLE